MAKYGKKGWIKLWRAEMDNPLYDAEPFDKWHAWADLLMMADSEGTVRTSLEALKNQWLWGSRHKVRDFLETLEGTGMGTVKTTKNKGTLIRINTDFLAKNNKPKNKASGTVEGTVSGHEELLPKEVGRGSSEITPPNNTIKEREGADDEYGYE